MATNEALRKSLKDRGINPKNPVVPANPLTALNAVRQALTTKREKRPTPPASTGPVVGPTGVLRAQTAARYGMSDIARQDFSQTPIDLSLRDNDQNAWGRAGAGRIWVSKAIRDTTPHPPNTVSDQLRSSKSSVFPAQQEILAHELGHVRYDQWPGESKWDQWPQRYLAAPRDESDYVTDVMGLANDPRYPNITKAYQNWIGDTAGAAVYGGEYVPTELDARLIQFGERGQQVPQWFRDKWTQNMWGDVSMGEGPSQTPVYGYRTPFGFQPADNWRKQW